MHRRGLDIVQLNPRSAFLPADMISGNSAESTNLGRAPREHLAPHALGVAAGGDERGLLPALLSRVIWAWVTLLLDGYGFLVLIFLLQFVAQLILD